MNIVQETYLQHMMRSMLKQLQQGQRDQALLSFVDAAMKVEQRKLVMETHYSQDLSLLYILQEDYDRAKYYANNCMQVFMQVSPGFGHHQSKQTHLVCSGRGFYRLTKFHVSTLYNFICAICFCAV